MLKRFLISFTMVAIVAILVTSTVFADQSTPHNGSFPPGFIRTARQTTHYISKS